MSFHQYCSKELQAYFQYIVLVKFKKGSAHIPLNKYLLNTKFIESSRYSYQNGHRAKTAIVRVKNVAFDTDDCEVLFCSLEDMFQEYAWEYVEKSSPIPHNVSSWYSVGCFVFINNIADDTVQLFVL